MKFLPSFRLRSLGLGHCTFTCDSLSCVSSNNVQSKKKHRNANNNNNNNTTAPTANEQNHLLEFYIYDVSHERHFNLTNASNDKRLIIFYNISNGLYTIGIRNGDVLVFLNDKNLLTSPIALTNDRIKSEFTSLRRHNKSIRIGICRSSDQSLFNHTTIRHLGTLTFDEFRKLSLDNPSTSSLNESRKSLTTVDEITTNTEAKTILKKTKPLIQKRSASPNRDSGFIETDGTNTSMVTDRSLISNYNKRRSKSSLEKSEEESIDTHKSLDSLQQSISKVTTEQTKIKSSGLIYSSQLVDKQHRNQRDVPTETMTDACFVYRRQMIQQESTADEKAALILRGREIAHEAANAPAIPSSMPNYTRDQIRELYGDLDKKTRRLQEDEYILHSPIKHSYSEKPQWKLASPTSKISDECPLPKFRLDQTPETDETLLMAAYLSTGLSNTRTKSIAPVDSFHTVMMNASAKVNEWANNNEIYLSPIEKDISQTNRPTISSLDVHFKFKKLAGTPTGNNNRPTFLEGIEQQTTNQSNEISNNRQNRRSIRRQQHMTDTTSSSPDSIHIALETTPSTPGSCGMYLEPYMRHGYDLPSIDHHMRDSSWQHDDIGESIKNITPIESPISTPKFDTNILPSPPMTSQIIKTDSLIDFDDGGTNSYHTAKESRIDTGRQSTISMESDGTTSTLHQTLERDDIINNIFSPEESFYYDALASPSQTNQQIISAVDKQNLLIDNLTNLLEEIETFNRTKHSLLTTIDEEKSRLSPEGEKLTNNIDQLMTIVKEIHEFNQPKTTNIVDNLLFIYDDMDEEQPDPLMDNLVEVAHTFNPSPSNVDNLLLMYDDPTTPTEDESKPIAHGSNEWSYDNLTTEQIDTDHLGMIIHEALTTRFQKPIKFKQANEVETAGVQEPINEIDDENPEPIVDTDHLGTIVHEALAARSQKSIKMKTTDQLEFQVPIEEFHELIDEPTADTDHLGTIIHEVLATRFQKPIKFKQTNELETTVVQEPINEIDNENVEPVVDTDHLGTIVHEALAARFQKPIKFKETNDVETAGVQQPIAEIDDENPEPVVDTDHLETVVHEALAAKLQKPIKFKQANEVEGQDSTVEVQEPVSEINDENLEPVVDTDHSGTIVHEALAARSHKSIKTETPDQLEFEVPIEEFHELIDEPTADTDHLGTIIHESLTTRFQKPIKIQPVVQFNQELINEPTIDTIHYETPQEPTNELYQESVPSTFEQPLDEATDNTHTVETIVYEIESLNQQPNFPTSKSDSSPPVSNLSQIVSDSLLTSSNYHRYNPDEHKLEFNITHQPPMYDEEIYEEYGYRRTTTDPETEDIVEKFEELCRRYSSNFDQYEKTTTKFDDEINQFEKQLHEQKEQIATPTSDTTSEELITTIERLIDIPDEKTITNHEIEDSSLTLTVKRQPNYIGKYGFDFEEFFDGKIKISSIIDKNYCPNLNLGDEIIGINNNRTFRTSEQCQLIFDTLWKHFYEDIQITVIKSTNIPIIPTSEPVSLQSSSLSWPLSESDFNVDNNNNKMQSYDDDFTKTGSSSYSSYKSQITPRSTNVQRRSGGPSGIMTRMYQSYSTSGGSGGFNTGGLGAGISGLASIAGLGNFSGIPLRPNRGSSALVAVNETREREKRELCQLNDKFAQYVEKVRFLEAQNRKLQLELEALQNKAGQGSSKIKEMYEVEMNEAKKLIDDTTRDRAAAEVKARDAEKEAGRYRKRYEEILNSRETDRSAIDRLQQQIAENEAQINLFRRRLGDLEDEARRYKAETQRLASEIARLQNEIQNETFVKSSLDTEKMALEDELAMLKQMHEADLNELRSKTVVDVNLDPSHFFRNELAQAIRDIRNEFEALNDQQRADLHNRYMMSYNELILRHQKPDLDPIQSEQQRVQEEKLRTTLLTTRNEVAHMKARNEELNNRIRELQLHIDQERDEGGRLVQKRAAEIEELRRKLEQLQKEYEEVTNMKTSLEKEINTYRELLEGTNNREGLKQIVDHVVEEARRMEAERATSGSGAAGSISYSGGGGRSTTISRTFISSSGSGSANTGIGGLVTGPGRVSSSYGGAQGGGGGSYSQTSSRREYTSSS